MAMPTAGAGAGPSRYPVPPQLQLQLSSEEAWLAEGTGTANANANAYEYDPHQQFGSSEQNGSSRDVGEGPSRYSIEKQPQTQHRHQPGLLHPQPQPQRQPEHFHSQPQTIPPHPRPRTKRRNKISKKQNARMQLAAALIEADNDLLATRAEMARAAEEEWRAKVEMEYARRAAQSQGPEDDIDPPLPPPLPPLIRLACESVIFKPFQQSGAEDEDRDEADEAIREPEIEGSALGPLSRTRSIQKPPSPPTETQNFLGVFLPGDEKTSTGPSSPSLLDIASDHAPSRSISRASHVSRTRSQQSTSPSMLTLSRTETSASRARSAISMEETPMLAYLDGSDSEGSDAASTPRQTARAEPDFASWGLEKYLSSEARQKIDDAKSRRRAISTGDVQSRPLTTYDPSPDYRGRLSLSISGETLGNSRPTILALASNSSTRRPRSLSASRTATRGPMTAKDLELLRKIQQYREKANEVQQDAELQRSETCSNSQLPATQEGQSQAEDNGESVDAGNTSGSTDDSIVAFPRTPTLGETPVLESDGVDKPSEQNQQDSSFSSSSSGRRSAVSLFRSSSIDTSSTRRRTEPSLRVDPSWSSRTATRQGLVAEHLPQMTTGAQGSLFRRRSSRGYTGDSWSARASTLSRSSSSKSSKRLSRMSSRQSRQTISRTTSLRHEPLHQAWSQVGSSADAYLFFRVQTPQVDQNIPGQAYDASQAYLPQSTSAVTTNETVSAEEEEANVNPWDSHDASNPFGGRPQSSKINSFYDDQNRHLHPQSSKVYEPAADMTPMVSISFERFPGPQDFSTAVLLQGDYASALALGPSAYPKSLQAGRRPSDPLAVERPAQPSSPVNRFLQPSEISPVVGSASFFPQMADTSGDVTPRLGYPGAAMSTRQLQELATRTQYPDSYGIITPFLLQQEEGRMGDWLDEGPDSFERADGEEESQTESIHSLPVDGWEPPQPPGLLQRAFRRGSAMSKLKDDLRASVEPDLSSSRWGTRKRKMAHAYQEPEYGPPRADGPTGHELEVQQSLDWQTSQAIDLLTPELRAFAEDYEAEYRALVEEEPDIDVDFVSPPQRGPLKPQGVDARLSDVLMMPQRLQGTPEAPRMRIADDDSEISTAVSSVEIQRKRRAIAVASIFPVAAPPGIGRRANMSTTALFRNQLVRRVEDKEGWGWELSTRPYFDLSHLATAEKPVLTKKQRKARLKAATKEYEARYMRKQARALRRKKRQQATATGRSYADMGVPEDSPVEDLSLTEDSEGMTDPGDSSDEGRWQGTSRPAGKLFGKSLLDVAEEKALQKRANRRFYGQQELDEHEAFERASAGVVDPAVATAADARSLVAPSSAARSFAENPSAYNDTRERMQVLFGVDQVWAREMAVRRREEAVERVEEERARQMEEIQRIADDEVKRIKDERASGRKMFGKKKKKNMPLEGLRSTDMLAGSKSQDVPHSHERSGYDMARASSLDQTRSYAAEWHSRGLAPPFQFHAQPSQSKQHLFGTSSSSDFRPISQAMTTSTSAPSSQPFSAQMIPRIDLSFGFSPERRVSSATEQVGRTRNRKKMRNAKGNRDSAVISQWVASDSSSGSGSGSDPEQADEEEEDDEDEVRDVESSASEDEQDRVPLGMRVKNHVKPATAPVVVVDAADSSDDDDDDEGGLTLAQIRQRSKAAAATATVIATATATNVDESSDDEGGITLAQLKARRKLNGPAAGAGTGGGDAVQLSKSVAPSDAVDKTDPAQDDDDDDNDEVPFGFSHNPERLSRVLSRARKTHSTVLPLPDADAIRQADEEVDDEDDDVPLGFSHDSNRLSLVLDRARQQQMASSTAVAPSTTLPLSQSQSVNVIVNLNNRKALNGKKRHTIVRGESEDEEDEEDEDGIIAIKTARPRPSKGQGGGVEDEDDDAPIGLTHPDFARHSTMGYRYSTALHPMMLQQYYLYGNGVGPASAGGGGGGSGGGGGIIMTMQDQTSSYFPPSLPPPPPPLIPSSLELPDQTGSASSLGLTNLSPATSTPLAAPSQARASVVGEKEL